MMPSAYCSSTAAQHSNGSKRIARAGKRGRFIQADEQNIDAARHLQNFLENYLARLRAHLERESAAGREAESAIGSQLREGSAALAEHLRLW